MTSTTDHDAVSQTIRSCISIPVLSLAVDDTTLYIRLPARDFTDLQEMINLGTLAKFFNLTHIVLRRRDVMFKVNVSDLDGVIDGSVSMLDLADRIETSAFSG